MKLLITTFVALSIAVTSFAQQAKNKSRYTFTSINQVGLLSGSSGESFNLQSINGFKKGTCFAGIGVALDYYMERSVPLFLAVSKDFKKDLKTPFVYANGGANFPWLSEGQKGFDGQTKTKPGCYFDFGGGYKIPLKNGNSILMSVGYNYKSNTISEQSISWTPGGFSPVESTNTFFNKFNRVNLKVGIQF